MDEDWSAWAIRGQESDFDPKTSYANHPEFFTLEVHHGGEFIDTPDFKYVGELAFVDKVHPIWCGTSKFQVTGPGNEQRVVNVNQRTCSCRCWELNGLPCRHAVAAILNMKLHGQGEGEVAMYVDRAYWLDTWKSVYAHTIEPINGMDLRPKSACPTTLVSPKYHKQIGRPKKKRKKYAVEIEELSQRVNEGPKMPRQGNSLSCTVCKGKGHNKRTCRKSVGAGTLGGVGSSGTT